MREIKFRAWNEYEQCFLDNEEFAINFLGTVFKANLDAEVYNNLMNQDSFKIMQYTGLKDKNGIEIYEGDIIKVLGTECTVIWQQGAFKFQKNRECYYVQHLSDFATSDKCVAYKVIGNIYENPELLQGN